MQSFAILALFIVVALVTAVAALSPPERAAADFHEVQIKQVMAGAFGNDGIEFLELGMLEAGQNCIAGGKTSGGLFGCVPPTPTDGSRLVFFDASGNQTGEFVFRSNVPIGGSGRSILVGTEEFAQAFSVRPDLIMPSNVAANSGRVCYRNVPGASEEVNDCLAYGGFMGSNETFGAPSVALPVSGSSSLMRMTTTFNNATDFRLGEAAPKNNNNEIGGLAFTAQPRTAAAGSTISPALRIEVRDALGNRVASAGNSITIALGTNPNEGTLSGTTAVGAVNGVATFPDLSIDKPGVGYTLVASALNLSSATSVAFDVLACQPGDANGDGNINALDITTIELIVASTLADTPCADANGDGNANALDITATEILVATAPSTDIPLPIPTPTPGNPTMVFGSAAGAPGEEVTLAISVDTGGATVLGVQVNLAVDGTILTGGTGGKGAALPAAWLFASNSPAPGDLRLLSLDLSGEGQALNGPIFSATFTIDFNAPAGDVLITGVQDVRDESVAALVVVVTNGVVTVGGL